MVGKQRDATYLLYNQVIGSGGTHGSTVLILLQVRLGFTTMMVTGGIKELAGSQFFITSSFEVPNSPQASL